ncbi:MAG: CO2 hydration protein [Pseudanabaena sp.]|jgi:CO2 hydration protein|nr:CO2 hydration protein [Pseudanabaena sp. M53BS1SP1A06MG]MCA6583836.1 CO2 hydration protein [Pseudanabaena sp. M34BS1SP1A06MG]MCA6588283.1 CO2 hydration protein [Pseudanabaena sp. M109S1SP1A06QC]MCA6592115.1 CO2 hydration protein [Pseudanabaena sp. M38BS1SP1A06MG]MCA6601928.1 CO2 hydration protein [Pseudanabaena sp. M57BS1SP1A06MG]MCA6611380.1 CO2 hydration protein [Pseudanabaena sp. M158S2SP1A06QC]MCA6614493.1 CO2 hydration protein [Pseudanabaena sp. M090S1SP1A06QC]MCA6621358.1 CO2 hydrat
MSVSTKNKPIEPALVVVKQRLEEGGALLPDGSDNLLEVVGILKSYGVVLGEYYRNLTYISKHQFLEFFPFFKFFNGNFSLGKLGRHWWHDRINFEFAEYCMKAMFWHGGGGLDKYLDSEEFQRRAQAAIAAKSKSNPLMAILNRLFPDFLPEQVRLMTYYSALGYFWSFMSPLFLDLSDRYDRGEIKSIPDVVKHVQDGLVAAAAVPYVYNVTINGNDYDIVPKSANLSFLMDTAVPYVEAVFFRSFPFRGTVSYNAQAQQISPEISHFNYGVLYADPLPIGGAGIPPTLLMQDMRHYLPQYLHDFYKQSDRGEEDLLVKICLSFQKSMFCVTTAALRGLAPHPFETQDPKERKANDNFLAIWLDRLSQSRLYTLQ